MASFLFFQQDNVLAALFAGLFLFLLSVTWQIARERETQDPRPAREVGVRPDEVVDDSQNALPPEQPYVAKRWVVFIDTSWDGRLSDQDLLYLEAVLREEGIAADFAGRRPTRQFLGFVGPQYPTQLIVDAEKLDDAVAVRDELFGVEWQNFQLRPANPLMDVPGSREQGYALGGMARVVKDTGRPAWLRALVWMLIVAILASYLLPGIVNAIGAVRPMLQR